MNSCFNFQLNHGFGLDPLCVYPEAFQVIERSHGLIKDMNDDMSIIDQNPNEPQYAGLDPNRAYILGLLHDIGRREGVHGLRHIMDGYHFLAQEGYPDAGRVCLTHAFPDKTLIPDAARWDGTPEDLTFVRSYIQSIQYDIYDRLSQLVDSISMPHGFVLMEKRMVDVIMRYGANGNTPARYFVQRWKANFALVDEIESAIHGSIYTHLPGVIENTFEFTTNQNQSKPPV